MANPFIGYSGLIWNNVYKALDYYFTQLVIAQAANDAASVISLSQTMALTLTNAVDAINAYDYATVWQATTSQLSAVAQLPLAGISPTDAAYFTNRLAAYAAAYPALFAIVPLGPFPTAVSSMPNGTPVIPDVHLIEFYEAFAYEVQPAGLTSIVFAADALACARAFQNIANAVNVFQGRYPNQLLDICTQQSLIAAEVAQSIADFQSGTVAPTVGVTNAWSQIVALPALQMTGSFIAYAPFTVAAQQSAVIRYALLTYAQQISTFLAALTLPSTAQIATTVVRDGDTLMDIAARELGNFELWTQIAALNNLQPPWITPTTTATTAGIGTKLILPSPGTALPATGSNISYNQNLMGTDIFFGPINGDMPAWSGDLETITGFNNLRISLGRRLQTILGTLIYHSDYGSRIPAEIGQIQNDQTIGQVLAFGKSAIMSDRRVQSIPSAQVIREVGGTLRFIANVQPIGNQNSAITMDQAIVGPGG